MHDPEPGSSTAPRPSRLLVQLSPARWRAVDLDEIYLVEADGDDCRVRLRRKHPLTDVRRLADLEELLEPLGFVRIHRSFLVNPARVLELRRRGDARGREVVMEPPVNRVLPVSEERTEVLRERFA